MRTWPWEPIPFVINSVKKDRLDFVYNLFPRLAERRNQLAGTMSGGERKMLAIGRGLMPNPTLLLVDEPSFGSGANPHGRCVQVIGYTGENRGLPLCLSSRT